jgi:hypothetical protein
MSIRARLERLEQKHPSSGGINWDNLWARPEDIVPDGIIDWQSMLKREPWSPENNPIERAIAAVGRADPQSLITEPQASSQRPDSNQDHQKGPAS